MVASQSSRQNVFLASPIIARLAGFVVTAVGVVALIGIILDRPTLTSWGPGVLKMNVLTSMCLTALGVGLISAKKGHFTSAISIVVGTVGVLHLLEYVGLNVPLDWIIPGPNSSMFKMGAATSLGLLLGGIALASGNFSRICATAAALLLGMLGAFGLLDSLAGVGKLYRLASFESMALPAAISYLLLSTGLLARGGFSLESFRPRPLSHYLWALSLFIIAPLALFGVFAGVQLSAAQQEAIRQQLAQSARGLSETIDQQVLSELETLHALAGSPSLGSDDLAAFQRQAAAAIGVRGAGSILLVDKQNRHVLNTLVPYGRSLPNPAWSFERNFTSDAPLISGVFLDTVSEQPTIAVSIPIKVGGEVRYALGRSLQSDVLARTLKTYALPEGWRSGLSDANDVVIARSLMSELFIGRKINPPPRIGLQDVHNVIETTDLEGKQSLHAYHWSTVTGWRTAVWAHGELLNAPARILWRSLTLLSVAALALAGFLGWAISRVLTSSIAAPRLLINGLETDRRVQPPRTALVEIDQLGRALCDAAESRSRAHAAMRRSEQRFRGVFDHSPNGIAITDLQGRFQAVNSAYVNLLGYTEIDLHDVAFTDLLHASDIDGNLAEIDRLLRQDIQRFAIESRYIRKDGSFIWAGQHVAFLRDDAGAPTHIITIVTDITKRKFTEDDVRESDARFRRAIDAARLTVYDVQLSPGSDCEAVTTYGISNIIGEDCYPEPVSSSFWHGRIHSEDVATHTEQLKQNLGNPKCSGYQCEYRIRHKDGTWRDVLDNATIERNEAGVAQRLIGTIVDQTDRKRAEHRQRLLMQELAHRGKNLLAVIQSIAGRTLTSSRSTADAREAFMGRLHALANTYGSLTEEAFEGAPLDQIVALELSAFSGRAKIDGPPVMVTAKRAQTLTLVVHELATNAAKYGALSVPDGRVTVQWKVDSADGDSRFLLSWQEFGGPPARPPKERGFGTLLVSVLAGGEFECTPELNYTAEGFSYRIETSLSNVGALIVRSQIREKLNAQTLRDFYDDWVSLREADQAVPRLEAFNRQRFAATGGLTLAEVQPNGQMHFVEIGRALTERLGAPMEEQDLQSEDAMSIREAYYRCARGTMPSYENLRFRFGEGQVTTFERLLVPLSQDGKSVTHVAGLVVFTGETGTNQGRSLNRQPTLVRQPDRSRNNLNQTNKHQTDNPNYRYAEKP